MKQCYDCLAHYSDGYHHVCPPWLKMLVAKHRAERGGGVYVQVTRGCGVVFGNGMICTNALPCRIHPRKVQ